MRPDWKELDQEARIVAVAGLIAEDMSCSMIAGHFLNCTRNAVVGLVHRNRGRLKLSRKPSEAGVKKPKKKPTAWRAGLRAERAVTPPTPPPPPEPVRMTEWCDPVPFVHRHAGQCPWPLWDVLPADASTAPCCGAPIVEGKSWCEFHHDRSLRRVA